MHLPLPYLKPRYEKFVTIGHLLKYSTKANSPTYMRIKEKSH